MPELQIKVLGGFRLNYRDTPVSNSNSPRLQALLTNLVLHCDMPQPRQHLAFQIWPDSSEAQARTNLRQLIHGLKQMLPEADQYVHTDTQTLQWRCDAPFYLDVAVFDQAIGQAHVAEQQRDRPTLQAALERAIAVYDGDLLPSCYDDWILPERERLRQSFTGALERLMLLLEQEGDLRAAIVYAQRLLRHDPVREETYRALMRLYAAAGDRAGALRVYHTCEAVLKRELEVEPSAATRQAYEDLLQENSVAQPVTTSRPAQTNLPVPLTSFVGRGRELNDLKHQILSNRLLTLTGPGGTGKTRIALELAAQVIETFAGGVWLIELAPLTDPARVLRTVAATLGVRDQPGRTFQETLMDYLRDKSILLIFDNCEHLIEACATVADTLLSAAPGLKILVTSRESLGIAGETTYRVPSLSPPNPQQVANLDTLSRNDCVRLFLDRAGAVYPPFRLTAQNAPAIAQICRRLDGIPLAIELAAARIKVFTPEQIEARLDDRFRLLTGGSRTALERHQTLQSLIDWSYDLLPETERRLLRRLSVFAGGWSFEAAQMMCGDGSCEVLAALARLVDKSLIEVEEPLDGLEARYRFLETIRQYARDKLLASGESEQVRDQHLEFYLHLAESAEPRLRGAEQQVWFDRLEAEHDNLRTALAWSVERGNSTSALRLVGALCYFWEMRGYVNEGSQWANDALALAERVDANKGSLPESSSGVRAATARRAKALFVAGRLGALATLDFQVAGARCQESLGLWRQLGDEWWMAVVLECLGMMSIFQGDVESARGLLEESVSHARLAQDPWPLALCLLRSVSVLMRTDIAAAHRVLEEAIPLARTAGDKTILGLGLHQLACTLFIQGNLASAGPIAEEALANLPGNEGTIHVLLLLVAIEALQDNQAKAASYSSELAALAAKTGTPYLLAHTVMALAYTASIGRQPQRAVRLLAAVEGWLRRGGFNIGAWGGVYLLAHNQFLDIARAQLDRTTFEIAWAEGQQLTTEQVLALALQGQNEDSQLSTDGH